MVASEIAIWIGTGLMTLIRKIQSKLRRISRGINKYAVRVLPLSVLGGVRQKIPILQMGVGSGSWDVPAGVLDKNWICYSVGVGRDSSFEIDLVRQFDCTVVSFDPTPASVEYINSLSPLTFRFYPWAIWINDGHLDFFSQDLENKVNLSVIDSGRGEHLCRAECYRLKTAMMRLEHNRIDLLKIDIEGAWLPVIEDMVASEIKPRVFCVEFDSPTSVWKVRHAVRMLAGLGLLLVHRSRDNYLFVNQQILDGKK